jgi:uncharacterized protein YndB with AHSA1/START domain
VFRALTEGHHLQHWFCDAADSDPGAGGALSLRWTGARASAEPFEGRWRAFDPDTHCAFDGGHTGYPDGYAGRVDFELEPKDGATHLIVKHAMPETPAYAGWIESYRGAWPRALDRLREYVTPGVTGAAHGTHFPEA